MILDIIKALFFAGLPIAIISYYLILLTSTNIKLTSKNSKELKRKLKTVILENQEDDHFAKKMLQKKSHEL